MAGKDKVNLTDSLKKLEAIAEWFEAQQEVDVEAGLTKVKDAAKLIKQSKARLAEIENEFETIEKDMSASSSDGSNDHKDDTTVTVIEAVDDIPF